VLNFLQKVIRRMNHIPPESDRTSPKAPRLDSFFSTHYQDHNCARLTHLATLGLPLDNRVVLDVGSGPGDHTGFYLERGCGVFAIDGREECLAVLKRRYPQVKTALIDMNEPAPLVNLGNFEVIHCYGLLYHLHKPQAALGVMAQVCSDLMVLETCVAYGGDGKLHFVQENSNDFTQSITPLGCRPTRAWVFGELKRHFEFVYQTKTQPNHAEFPLDWSKPVADSSLIRAVFVAARHELDLPTLSPSIVESQVLAPG
jgi:2-polyprenyl-3-methyl-5-hydroxy-6-metoxy-1,4-benzoquinol methylase